LDVKILINFDCIPMIPLRAIRTANTMPKPKTDIKILSKKVINIILYIFVIV